MSAYRDDKPLIPNGPPGTVDVARDVSYFDFGADQYKCMCNSVHSKMGVIIMTILGYIHFIFSLPSFVFVVSSQQWYTLPVVLYILFNLMLTLTLHSALTQEKHMMMIPSIICSLLNVLSVGVVLMVSVAVVVVGQGSNVVEHLYMRITNEQLPREIAAVLYTIMWISIILITLAFLLDMWILEIQLKYYNCIRDKKQFGERTTTYYVNRTYVDPRALEGHGMHPYM